MSAPTDSPLSTAALPPPPPPPGNPPLTAAELAKKRRKCGTPKGGKHVTHPQSDWYQLCLEYTKLQCEQEVELQMEEDDVLNGEDDDGGGPKFKRRKLSQRQFLKQQTIVPNITGELQSHVMTFSRNLKRFHAGTLENSNQKRSKSRQYEDIEQRLIAFIGTSAGNNTVCTWEVMQEKCREWALELQYDQSFKASAGWLHKTLKRHNLLQTAKKGLGEMGNVDDDDDDNDDDDNEPLNPNATTHRNGTETHISHPILPPILPTQNNNNNSSGVNFCRNCSQWKQIHNTLSQEKNTAYAKIRRLEQHAAVAQRKLFELEKKLKISQQEVSRLKGVVKAALKID